MVTITMKVPENKKCHRGLFPAVCCAAVAMLSLSSYSYGQAQGMMGQGMMGQGMMGQGMMGQGMMGQGMPGQGQNVSPNAAGGGWRILPRLSLRETYSDNIRLGGQADAGADMVTQINPGLLVTGVGRRFNVNASYMMNNLIYAEHSNFTRMRHQFNATATTELIENLFFVDGRAAMFQQNASLFGPQGVDNVNVTGNRADVKVYTISPYLRHRFQDFASTELRYTYGIVESNFNALRNSHRNAFQAGLNSGDAFRILNWGLNYSNQMIDFDKTGRSVEMERAVGNLRYMVTPRFGLTATGGYERNTFISIRGSPTSPTWTVGFSWIPDERTNIVATAGQRFFGDTYSVLANHRTRLTVWNASYDQNITTFNQQAGAGGMGSLGGIVGTGGLGGLGGLGDPGGLSGSGSFLDPTNFFTNRLFLQKRLQATVGINGATNSLMLRVFDMTRKAFSPESDDADLLGANAALLNHTRQSGVNGLWSYRISALTRANFSLGYTRFSFLTTDRKDDFKIGMVSLTRQFQAQPAVNGTIQLRHIERDSNQGASYSENAVIASLNMTY